MSDEPFTRKKCSIAGPDSLNVLGIVEETGRLAPFR